MKTSLTAATLMVFGATSIACATPAFVSVPMVTIPMMMADAPIEGTADILNIKDDKGKGQKNGKKWRKEREKAGKAYRKAREQTAKAVRKEAKTSEKALEKAAKEVGSQIDGRFVTRVERTDIARRDLVDALLSTRAPDGRDMVRVLSAAPLALLGRDVIIDTLPEEELLTYRNCPPGLAKKDPPCVPPGLAKKGVSYEDWVSYDDDDFDDLLIERRGTYLDEDRRYDDFPENRSLLLSSAEVARLFDLDPAPDGQRYALIDGMPVLVDGADYATLVTVSELSRVADLGGLPRLAPTAALTQDELRRIYRLPASQSEENYAVLNGELIALDDNAYETLQLIRIARAVF